jgi:bifunctional non-homologous end joining protein LigD
MHPFLQPMPLTRRAHAFDHSDWLFELKYDGFRALAYVERGKCELVSRNGHPFVSFSELGDSIAREMSGVQAAILDGEIVCLDSKGRPQFRNLLFRRGEPCFFAFDLLHLNGKDCHRDALAYRKVALRGLLKFPSADSRLSYTEHVEGAGVALYERVCELDLEGIVAKYKFAPYLLQNGLSAWYKIRNRNYSQMVGREKLFEQDRHREPVPGWHCCELACAKLEQING